MAPERLAPITPVTFKVTSEPSYKTFVTDLCRALAGVNPATVVGPKSKLQRPVLTKETGPLKQPPRWIRVELNVVTDDGKTIKPKVAIRSDNAYIVGFTNREEQWFQLSKTGADPLVDDDKKKPVKMLGFNENYNTLVKGGVDGLPALNLSKNGVAKAAATLWDHTAKKLYGSGGDDDDRTAMLGDPSADLKKAIATLCVALSEAARFAPVSDVINKGWGTSSQVSITAKEVSYIKEWGDMSTQLLKWKKTGYKNDKELFKQFVAIGIDDGEKALAVVQLVKLIERSLLGLLVKKLKNFLGLLVTKLGLQQDGTTVYEKPKGSAVISPL